LVGESFSEVKKRVSSESTTNTVVDTRMVVACSTKKYTNCAENEAPEQSKPQKRIEHTLGHAHTRFSPRFPPRDADCVLAAGAASRRAIRGPFFAREKDTHLIRG
jgi:hypothetical protein